MLPKLYLRRDLEKWRGVYRQVLKVYKIELNSPDLLVIEAGDKIQIEDIKKIKQFLSVKPYQQIGRAVVLEDIDGISEIVQNSLLKTIEELSDHNLLILGGNKTAHLLATFLSRIELVYEVSEGNGGSKQENFEKIENLFNLDLAERFASVEKVTDKEKFMQQFAQYLHLNLAKPGTAKLAEEVIEIEAWIKSNCNARACLEYLMLSMSETD